MSNDDTGAGTDLAEIEPGLVAQFQQMAMMIPEQDSAGMENILRQVLTAGTWDDLDAPWESTNADSVAGRKLKFLDVHRMPSDFRSGLGIFLVCQCVDINTGEQVTVTTSAVGIVAQLARAYALRAMPIIAEFIIAERPSKNGFHPHHLKMHASAAAVPGDGGR